MNSHDKEINMSTTDTNNQASLSAADEAQLAQQIVHLLDARAQHLSMAESQRLSNARAKAVNQLAQWQTQQLQQNGNRLQWLGGYVGHHRLASTLLLVGALLMAVFAIQHLNTERHLERSDAFLLASELPPEAYADKGFNAWVEAN